MSADRYSAAVLANNPRAYYKFQEASGLPQDSSGNGLHCTSGGASVYQQPGFVPLADFAMEFAGGVGPVRTPEVSVVQDNWTLEMWVKPESVTANGQLMFYNGNSGANGWGLLINSDKRIQGLAGGVALIPGTSSAPLSTTDFNHVACVRRATVWEYYINGALDTPNAGTNTPNVPSGTVSMGGAAAGNFQWQGEHYALYETPLSAAQIKANYDAAFLSNIGANIFPGRRLSRGTSW